MSEQARPMPPEPVRQNRSLPWLALGFSILLYCVHFFIGGGRAKIITDSDAYLFMAGGGSLGPPYQSRVLGPFLASLLASALGISPHSAFRILTPAALLISLILLRRIISRQGGSIYWQAALLLAFGCALGTTFGYTPVMIDPLLLVFTCLAIVALERGHLLAAFVLAALACLTKEYGIFIALAVAVIVYFRGHQRIAITGGLASAAPLVILALSASTLSSGPLPGWQRFLSAMLGYHTSVYRFRGSSEYPKILYMWSWSVLWPVLLISAGIVLAVLRRRKALTDHQIGLCVCLFALPLLLLGDFGRTLLIVVPFACAVATSHPLARSSKFAALLAVGGLSTALARPFHGESSLPQALPLVMTLISIAASLLLAVMTLRFAASPPGSNLDSAFESRAAAVADR